MDLLQTTLLAILQGLTEFLPISSSAHLILVPKIGGWADQGLAFDVAVHVGTLAAVIGYFRHDLKRMVGDWFLSIARRQKVGDSHLVWAVGFGTIPVGIAGLLFKDSVEGVLRDPLVIATSTVIFGLLLWWADAYGRRAREENSIGWRDVLIIGIAQAVALIPGTSRSGITMTAGLMMGLTRTAAARFSFLLSIPVILLAGGLNAVELITGEGTVAVAPLLLGALISALSAYLCIRLFLSFLERSGMLPFVIYRLVLGVFLFAIYL